MKTSICRVDDIADQIRGVNYRKQDASTSKMNGFLPVLRAGNITNQGLTYDNLVYVPASKISSKQKIQKNDIVIATSSGSLDVVGKAARALEDFEGGFGAFCKVLRPCKAVDAAYFAQFFKTPEYRRTVSFLAAGANINNLRNEDLDGLKIPLPPIAEQKRIAAILDAADALRVKRKETLAQLDTLIQSIFVDMFGDPVINPKGWVSQELSEVVKTGTIVTYGIVQAGEEFPEGVPYIRTGDIVDGVIKIDGLRHTNPKIAAKFERSKVRAGEIVLSIRATVGTAALVPAELDGSNLTQGTARISPGQKTEPFFLFHFIRTKGCQEWFKRQIKGATFREITLKRLRQMPVYLPPIELQRRFATIVESIEQQKVRLRAHLVELDTLFASLQSLAFNGEL